MLFDISSKCEFSAIWEITVSDSGQGGQESQLALVTSDSSEGAGEGERLILESVVILRLLKCWSGQSAAQPVKLGIRIRMSRGNQ